MNANAVMLTGMGDQKPLAGRHAIVTGGGRGIGAYVADRLAKLGADVTVMGRTRASLDERVSEIIARYGVRAFAQTVDLTDVAAIPQAFAAAAEQLGAPTILINNAGISDSAPFLRTTLDHWNRLMLVDATAPFVCTQQVLKGMLDAKWGRVVTISSSAGLSGYPYIAAYCAAKHASIGMIKALAREVATKGVTVNAVCPSYVETDMVNQTLDNIVAKTGRSREDALAELVVYNPQKRLVQPEEVADAAAWLCLPSSAAVTGQSIILAGGELM